MYGPNFNPDSFKKVEVRENDVTLKDLCKTMLEADSYSCTVVLPGLETDPVRIHVHIAMCMSEDSEELRCLIAEFLTRRMSDE